MPVKTAVGLATRAHPCAPRPSCILHIKADLRHAGFTLIEVLIALAVLAIALAAVMQTVTHSIDLTQGLRDRNVALWVAQNRLTQHQITHNWPTPDTTEGTVEMAGRSWHWREQVSTTPEAQIRRVAIEVRADKSKEALARLNGFLDQPPP